MPFVHFPFVRACMHAFEEHSSQLVGYFNAAFVNSGRSSQFERFSLNLIKVNETSLKAQQTELCLENTNTPYYTALTTFRSCIVAAFS